MSDPSNGVLATPCPACEGSGTLPENHGQGMVEWLGCPDCHATGWWVHEDVVGVSLSDIIDMIHEEMQNSPGVLDGWSAGLRSLLGKILRAYRVQG